ncbi:J domain-containing protein, partial [Vibrio rotiferianus]
MSFRTIALTLTLSACLTSTAFASQSPTQPEAQFDLALKPNPDSPSDVRYWLEQAARQSYIPAQKQLAEDYARGLTGNVDFAQATYWFTSVALNDPTDRGFLLADFVQHHQNRISTEDLLEAWYQLAALKNPQAEEAYNQFLEERFNQLRAKQVSEIVELDKNATHEQAQDKAAVEQEQKAETTNMWYASGA